MQTVTSGLCFAKTQFFLKIIQFNFEIIWMSSQLIVQWNYKIYFHIRGSFFNNFSTSFWRRVHNSEEIVNIQGLFALTVGYLRYCYISTNKVSLILLKEYTLFICCLYYLSVHFHSCCFYIKYHGGIRDTTSVPVQIFCFVLYY